MILQPILYVLLMISRVHFEYEDVLLIKFGKIK